METIETVTETTEIEETSFATELAKATAMTAATTAGMLVGMAAFGFVKTKLDDRKARKAAETTETPAE